MSKYGNLRKKFLIMWQLGPIFSKKKKVISWAPPPFFLSPGCNSPPKKIQSMNHDSVLNKATLFFSSFQWTQIHSSSHNLSGLFFIPVKVSPNFRIQITHQTIWSGCALLDFAQYVFHPQASSIFNWVHVKVSPKAYAQTIRLRVGIAQSHCQI
jgi:hypothetical protein